MASFLAVVVCREHLGMCERLSSMTHKTHYKFINNKYQKNFHVEAAISVMRLSLDRCHFSARLQAYVQGYQLVRSRLVTDEF